MNETDTETDADGSTEQKISWREIWTSAGLSFEDGDVADGDALVPLDDTDGKGCVSTKCSYSGERLYLARRGTKRRVLCCEHAADFLDLSKSDICGEAREGVVA